MRSRRSRRLGRAGAVLAGVGLLGGLLGGCSASPSATALVQDACTHVGRSISLYHEAAGETGASARHLRAEALVQLRKALRPAALAGSAGGQFQALQATLSESSRVPERKLLVALSAQCAAVSSS